MKKFTLILVVLLIATAVLVGCTPADVPGSAWAQKEVLTYTVTRKSADATAGTEIGTAVSTLKRVRGEVAMTNVEGQKHNVSNGTYFMMETTDLLGEVIMRSEFVMDGFRPVASYKMVKYAEKDYEFWGVYGSKYEYTYKNNKTAETKTGAISAKEPFMDNEFIYMYIRCYSFEAGIAKSFNLMNPIDNTYETVSVKNTSVGEFNFKMPGTETEKKLKTTVISISRTTVPVGRPIKVTYSNFIEDGDLNLGSDSKKDYHIPLVIEENDLVYLLKSELSEVSTANE